MLQMDTFIFSLLILAFMARMVDADGLFPFTKLFHQQWGGDHLTIINDTRVQLLFDNRSGAGFQSNLKYRSGFFHIRWKLSKNQSPGIITSFFLGSKTSDEKGAPIDHDELDFEFFGTKDKPFLNTNIFAHDNGFREQSVHLWFDPTADFHSYDIIWNANQIVFLVDLTPIRVYKNYSKEGANYPSGIMDVEASIWHASWAGEVDWSKAPFTGEYESFIIGGCPEEKGPIECASKKYAWNTYSLTPEQLKAYENVRKNYMFFDYCTRPLVRKKECDLPIY